MPNRTRAPKRTKPSVVRDSRAGKVQTIAPPAPVEKDYTPKKAVEKQLARRKIILDCIRVSITSNDEILAQLHARGYTVSATPESSPWRSWRSKTA